MENYKKYYQKFLSANPDRLHFAAHSHYYWPDVTHTAHNQYWEDACKFADEKWGHIFGTIIPEAQKLIAEQIKVSHPEQIVFAPNTHEFVLRILSCFDPKKQLKILSTDSEFYSFERQIQRMKEDKLVNLTQVTAQPIKSFNERFIDKIKSSDYDLIFLSHVFFNSGLKVKDLNAIVKSVKDSNTMIVIDGYHGFMATNTDLSQIEERIFYLSGSYKYAQGGEGGCFMYVPKGCKLRPINTGWFAEMDALSDQKNSVLYNDSGLRFAGATMDFSSIYRLIAVLKLFKEHKIDQSRINTHIQSLQQIFIKEIMTKKHKFIHLDNLLIDDHKEHGSFLTFNLETDEITAQYAAELKQRNIWVDYRGNRLRFGFALYHSKEDIISLVKGL